MNFLIRLLISALAAMATAYVLPGVKINSFSTALVLAIVLAILNLLVKPVLILLTLPVTIVTLGLFLLVINAVIIMIASSLVSGFKVDGFIWALLFSLVLTVVTGIMNSLAGTNPND
ncbi:phage holin family protein [Chitinophaga sancti]|uniref:Phage holin family protein n=1 Tax=Chitinophaga sancti TaxID=1004 RepID=A0A1K1SYV7_9BACT|nr:phage holin family protein [Chitinophaga sancti]WQD60514.1 phage holin family protein [Chitinophaga sancti]WQG87359.1 phage holin family protein [Chitinophaga sancti]SFW89255.1 putative membrane protein [Chitinophaga sancti]